MLNANMFALLGPQCQDLDMAALQSYNFDPMRLLSQLTDIYVQCAAAADGGGERFLEALAKAARFDPQLLHKAAATLRSLNYDSDKIAAFEAVVARVEVRRTGKEEKEKKQGTWVESRASKCGPKRVCGEEVRMNRRRRS